MACSDGIVNVEIKQSVEIVPRAMKPFCQQTTDEAQSGRGKSKQRHGRWSKGLTNDGLTMRMMSVWAAVPDIAPMFHPLPY